MNTEKIPNRCPKCGSPLPADAPQGLCAKCLLAAAATPTEAGQPHGERWTPPPLGTIAVAFPQLEILQLIGTGGMGAVYKARQPKLDRFVALKILPQALANDAGFAERFSREARLLARLNHAGIVSVYDYGETGGFFYLLMEFVDGVNLRQAMRAGRFSPQQALFIVPKICEALQFAHDEGILHRDIKPENILLDTRGRVKIADFGIAKLIGDKIKGTTLTASGMVVGTPHYMAPEQLEHPQDVDQRADIYSLGVVFYEMLTGELPIGRFAPPSKKTPVDPRVDAVVLQALEKERERRQHNAAEVKTEIEQITTLAASARGSSTPASGDLDAVAAVEPPDKSGADLAPTNPSADKSRGRRCRRPFLWTVSAWVFVAIGLHALVDTLAGLYSRPMHPTFSPGLSFLVAGIALLTLSRRWRLVALAALALALATGLFIVTAMAISPGRGYVDFLVLNLTIPASEKPWWAAAASVFLVLVLLWPCYLLLSQKAKTLFGLARPK